MHATVTRRISLALLAAFVLWSGEIARAEEETPHDLFKRVVDNIPHVPFVAKMKLTNRGSTVRELELSHKQLNGTTYAAYLLVTSPQDVSGTRFLIVERTDGPDEQYVVVPQVGRVVRLVIGSHDQQQLLGSEFYVSDLNLPDPNSLEATFAGTETIDGRQCKLIDVVAKADAQWQYKKARYAVDPTDLIAMRAEFEDEKGPVKAWKLEKVEKIEGIWTPRIQVMKNVRDNVESQLEILDIHYHADLPDSLFTRSELERHR